MLFLRNLKKRFWLVPIITAVLCIVSYIQFATPAINSYPNSGFIDYTELFAPTALIILLSFLLIDDYEIELAMTNGIRTARHMFSQFFATLLCLLIPFYVIIGLYKYTPYYQNGPLDQGYYEIKIPENYKLYMLISVTVTILFFASVLLLVRVVCRNYYVPIGVGLCVVEALNTFNGEVRSMQRPITSAYFDLFISNNFLGNIVTAKYGHEYLWTVNRLIFLAVSTVLILISYFVLRREHLHESFSD